MAADQKIHIRLEGLRPRGHRPVDQKIVETVTRTRRRSGARSAALPRSTASPSSARRTRTKDSREHFEMRIHKRLIDIIEPTPTSTRCSVSICPPASTSGSDPGTPDETPITPPNELAVAQRPVGTQVRGDTYSAVAGRRVGTVRRRPRSTLAVARVTCELKGRRGAAQQALENLRNDDSAPARR